MSSKKVKKTNLTFNSLKTGVALIILAFILGGVFFYPVIFQEINFWFNRPNKDLAPIVSRVPATMLDSKYIVAADSQFSIVIPKIGANSKINKNINPYNANEYQKSLATGVAHAKGTAFPGELGNVFLFAHSSDNFYNANRYNAVFYLLNKMEKNDDVFLVYKGEVLKYQVVDVKIVEESEVQYLENSSDTEKVTLMTCWPAGTSLKRLVVVAER